MDQVNYAQAETQASRNRARLAAALIVAATLVLPATAAGANEPNNGRSFCSYSGPRAGGFEGDIFDTSSYGNPGEVVSWFSQQGIHPGPWGHTVRAFCDPKAP